MGKDVRVRMAQLGAETHVCSHSVSPHNALRRRYRRQVAAHAQEGQIGTVSSACKWAAPVSPAQPTRTSMAPSAPAPRALTGMANLVCRARRRLKVAVDAQGTVNSMAKAASVRKTLSGMASNVSRRTSQISSPRQGLAVYQ